MKGKITPVAIIFIVVVSSFGAVGIDTNTSSVKDISADEKIEELQKIIDEKGWSFTVGKNSATDRTIDELCGFISYEEEEETDETKSEPINYVLPESFDWRDPDKNYIGRDCVTSVKNQGSCGSCWAFGTVGPLESKILIKEGVDVDLSEQWLVSCNTADYGCDGGRWAHSWHTGAAGICGGTGAVYESDFEYVSGQNGYEPPCDGPYPHVFLITNWDDVDTGWNVPDVGDLKQAIYDHGPVSAAVYVEDNFYYYTGGIFDTDLSGTVNHAVVLVGWTDDDSVSSGGYWIMKNSWGDWGEDGYMRIAYGCQSIGYSACYIDDYERISTGEETVNVYIKTITNEGDDYEPIDPIGARAPEWYYNLFIGPEFSDSNYNTKDGTEAFWYWDWEHEHTWDVEQGHVAYVSTSSVDVTIEVWDNDIGETDDLADITPVSGRKFEGYYDLTTGVLKYDGSNNNVPTEDGYYSISGTDNDNAKIMFEVSDSYNEDNFKPKISVDPTRLDFGTKKEGSHDLSFIVANTAPNDPNNWAPKLDWSATDDKSWITLDDTSGSLAGGKSDTVTVTVNVNELSKGDHSGTITVDSNDVSKTISVELTKSNAKIRNYGDIFNFFRFFRNLISSFNF
jgi:C1A family cysteine protease